MGSEMCIRDSNTAVIKQDDVDLINYPLDYESANYTEADKLQSLDYYANKQSPDGPAMTYSLYSISANALSPSGCSAYTYALNGFQPYTRAPWYQFSEQQVDNPNTNGGTNPAFPFMTGAGGWHQIGPMGWLGARVTESQLVIQPALPPQIPHVSLRTLIFGGTGLKAVMNYTHTTLTRVTPSSYLLPPNTTDRYANTTMPITVGFSIDSGYNISLALGQTLTIANRLYFDNTTTQGNILQCLPLATSSSSTSFQPGQFPLAAIDGAASTRWQPSTRNATSITIDMRTIPYQSVSGVSFDWGARPASTARIQLYNSSSSSSSSSLSAANDASSGAETVFTFSPITASSPYNATSAAVIEPYTGNMSFFTFSPSSGGQVYSGDYLTLTIEGCLQSGDELGATVAEFNLFAANGSGVLSGANGVSSGSDSGNGNGTVSVGAGMAGGAANQTVSVGTATAVRTSGAVSGIATAGLGGNNTATATGTGAPIAASSSGQGVLGVRDGMSWGVGLLLVVLVLVL